MANYDDLALIARLREKDFPVAEPNSPSPASIARDLLATIGKASLATLHPDKCRPYSSLVLIAPDEDGAPILLLSDLADHAKNLAADGASSLLLDGTLKGDKTAESLSGPRVSVEGDVELVQAEEDIARMKTIFIARHPEADLYAQFTDFRIYKMAVRRLHLIAGFGRIHWLDAKDVLGHQD